MKIRKAVIPAAGLGTRVLPASKSMPKEMLPLWTNQPFSTLWRRLWLRASQIL